MPQQDLDRDVLLIFRDATRVASKEVKELMERSAKIAMTKFYNDYTPKYYKRTDNLRNAYKGYIDSEYGHATKNEIKRRNRNQSIEHSAYLKVSTAYMPHSHHKAANGGGIYNKPAVMTYSYFLGFHGAPFITMRQNRKEGVLERQIKWFGSVPRLLTSGESQIAVRTSPTPDEIIERRVDAIAKNPDRLNAIMNEAFEQAFVKVSNNLDEIISKARL